MNPSLRALAPGRLGAARRQRRLERRMAGPRLLRAFAAAYPHAFFIEVGSNDGAQHDHLRPFILSHSWSGIMVEPVPYVFERLRHNYGAIERVTLENVAIADRDGTVSFHHLREAGDDERASLPEWYDGIGSFSRDVILGHVKEIPDIAERLVRAEVPSLTFESLCRKHAVCEIDLLLIDTEGHDWEIVCGIDLERRRPRLLIFEHFHLPARESMARRAHLSRHGYEVLEEGFDTFCLHRDAAAGVQHAWLELEAAVGPVYAEHE